MIVLLPCAGKGTRVNGLSPFSGFPKVLHRYRTRTLLEWAVEPVVSAAVIAPRVVVVANPNNRPDLLQEAAEGLLGEKCLVSVVRTCGDTPGTVQSCLAAADWFRQSADELLIVTPDLVWGGMREVALLRASGATHGMLVTEKRSKSCAVNRSRSWVWYGDEMLGGAARQVVKIREKPADELGDASNLGVYWWRQAADFHKACTLAGAIGPLPTYLAEIHAAWLGDGNRLCGAVPCSAHVDLGTETAIGQAEGWLGGAD